MTDLISFDSACVPVRDDIALAHRRLWQRLAAPGVWWTGAERVAIAAEVRVARDCAFCKERKQALSPAAAQGQHARAASGQGLLSAAAVEAIHRITTDASRLTKSWLEKLEADGLGDAHYVELLGVVVAVTSIDFVCRALGVPLHTLPEPREGEPSRVRPAGAVVAEAWVPTIPFDRLGPAESDLWKGRTGNVMRALSLVPDAVRDLKSLSAAHYVPIDEVVNLRSERTLRRPQIELIAGRVSALNECFY